MTNEEKAIELGYEKYPENKSYSTITETMQDYNYQYRKPFIEGALAMAEWKEKEMLDCAVSAYCEFCDTKECEGYFDMDGECDWKLKFEKKLLKK